MWPDLPRSDVILPSDLTALHFGAFHDGTLVGVGSFFLEGQSCQLRKLAVEPQFQGKGAAGQLLTVAMQYLQTQGCTKIWCDARVSASAFYVRNGFQLGTRVFQKSGLDYVVATREF
ncbi:MAG: GNAT family N-acetyltransferase [Paracoccaceae bacterium]